MPTFSPLLIICIFFAMFICSCRPQEDIPQSLENITEYISIDGFNIPRLLSSAEQLSFATASAASPNHQRALLKSVVQLFPEDRVEVGHAELEMAYLDLGTDYRNSLPEQRMNAASSYQKIALKYSSLPEIAAKALWYYGWISADLLQMKSIGQSSFRTIVDLYAEQPIAWSSFTPWTSINLAQEYDKPLQSQLQTSITWGELALLELIRHAPKPENGLTYYYSLVSYLPENTIITAALTLLAKRTDLTSNTVSAIKTEIDSASFTQKQQKELKELLLTTKQEGRQ